MQIVDILVEAEEALKVKRARRTKKEMDQAKRAKAKAGVDARREKRLTRYATEASKYEKSLARKAGTTKHPSAESKLQSEVTNKTDTGPTIYDDMDEAYDLLSQFDDDVITSKLSSQGNTGSFKKLTFNCTIETDDPKDVDKEIRNHDRFIHKIVDTFEGYDSVNVRYKPFVDRSGPVIKQTNGNLKSSLVIEVQ